MDNTLAGKSWHYETNIEDQKKTHLQRREINGGALHFENGFPVSTIIEQE